MRVVILYHPKSDHGGLVEDFARDYERARQRKLELISLETVNGATMARLYDVTNYPAVLVLAGDGSLQYLSQGLPLPLMSEIDRYSLDVDSVFARAQLISTGV